MTRVITGDCVEAMAAMDEASVDAVVCDPPYGLEFMGKEWDRLDGEGWRAGGGFSKPGIGDRPTAWASFGSGDTANATCATCGGRMRGARKCDCDEPDWRVKGKPLMAAGVDSRQAQGRKMQAWHEAWAREALRVLKPGGHLLAFGGTRTYHRLVCAVEDAGFEIRDRVTWLYGSGFPKSLDVSKAIDKAAGVEREVVGSRLEHDITRPEGGGGERLMTSAGGREVRRVSVTAPATDGAERWDGWGTALKPASEPIVMARKPLSGTVVQAVLEHGTGALNIDGCRVGMAEGDRERTAARNRHGTWDSGLRENSVYGKDDRARGEAGDWNPAGRWPANVVLSHSEDCVQVGTRTVRADGHHPAARGPGSGLAGLPGHAGQDGLEERHADGEVVERWACVPGCPVRALDEQTGELVSGRLQPHHRRTGARLGQNAYGYDAGAESASSGREFGGDAGGASRFFYTAKASSSERNAGLDGFEEREAGNFEDDAYQWATDGRGTPRAAPISKRNLHPTVKPLDLMRWLVRLVTPAGGLVLDPFLGSGTTGCAAILEGFEFVGIERDPEYVRIAEARMAFWAQHPTDVPVEVALRRDAERAKIRAAGQDGLF